jgi:hypothetical protein
MAEIPKLQGKELLRLGGNWVVVLSLFTAAEAEGVLPVLMASYPSSCSL